MGFLGECTDTFMGLPALTMDCCGPVNTDLSNIHRLTNNLMVPTFKTGTLLLSFRE